MVNAWVSWYYGDYMRDTGHLSLVEDGAYRRLLDHYYATRKPLPAIAEQLQRICRAVADEEKEAVLIVVQQFFILEADGYHNRRADEEIAKALEISGKRRAAAKKRHASASMQPPVSAPAIATAIAPTTTITPSIPYPPVAMKENECAVSPSVPQTPAEWEAFFIHRGFPSHKVRGNIKLAGLFRQWIAQALSVDLVGHACDTADAKRGSPPANPVYYGGFVEELAAHGKGQRMGSRQQQGSPVQKRLAKAAPRFNDGNFEKQDYHAGVAPDGRF